MNISDIFTKERKRHTERSDIGQRECQELVSTLKYLITNPITETEYLNEIGKWYPVLNYNKSFYCGCEDLGRFIAEHNVSKSPIKFKVDSHKSRVSIVHVDIDTYDEIITYKLI